MMRLHYHPASTTSRMVQLFAEEAGIGLDYRVVDLFTGEHLRPEFMRINPNGMVPVLEDGDFLLTESSAILKYLGDKAGSAAYPAEPKARARVHEMMDWFNANLCKDLAYGLVYPQLFPGHVRADEAVQAATLEWGRQKTQSWLKVLDASLIGPHKPYVCGDAITLADYQGAEMVALGELVGCRYAAYPNVERWLARMKALPSWGRVHEAIDGFAASLKGRSFVAI